MIIINKNSTNSLIFTLTEKSRLPSPNYLFSFVNDSSGNEVLFTSPDLSGYPRRYNSFDIIESGSTNPSIGIVELEFGFGKYEVYESSSPTLNISGTTGRIIENGKVFVRGWNGTMNNNNINNIYL